MSKELPFSRKPSQSGGKDNWVDAKEPMKRMTLDIPESPASENESWVLSQKDHHYRRGAQASDGIVRSRRNLMQAVVDTEQSRPGLIYATDESARVADYEEANPQDKIH